jgi:hypothetical protein
MIDIPALIHGRDGFVQVLGPRVLSTEPALLRLDAGPELHNHVGRAARRGHLRPGRDGGLRRAAAGVRRPRGGRARCRW